MGWALVALVSLTACGRRLPFDEPRIRKKCRVEQGVDVSGEQALCIARLAGLRQSRKCPLDLSEIDLGPAGLTIYRIRESCSDVGLTIDKRDGRVVAVELGDAIAASGPSGPGT